MSSSTQSVRFSCSNGGIWLTIHLSAVLFISSASFVVIMLNLSCSFSEMPISFGINIELYLCVFN